GAELQIANLDYRMSRKDLQQILHDTFSRYGQMMSLQQAISAVTALHRYKIGSKRIQVSLVTGGNSRSLSLLRYCRKLDIGDLYKLSDVLSVREQGSSRLVCLLPNIQIHKSPLGSSRSQEGSSSASGSPVVFEELEYHEPVCRLHYAKQDFSSLASEVHSLLQMHDGTLPLLRCFSRDWRVTDYGICDLMDLLAEIPDTTITITHQTTDMVISVPKRGQAPSHLKGYTISQMALHRSITMHKGQFIIQYLIFVAIIIPAFMFSLRTVEEMERTKQFGKEVVDLLRHQPHCRMPFSKFIPTYHHHFGRQCKLSYYGFTKLMELLEAIPDILMVLECGEEKVLILTEVERIKALAAQLVKLLRAQKNFSLSVSQLLPEYNKTFGYGLRLQDYDAASLPALLAKLCHVVKVVDGSDGREVQLINRKSLRLLTTQLLALLMSQENHQVTKGMKVEELSQHYLNVHGTQLNPCEYGFLSLSELLKSLPYLVEVGVRFLF
ncbi:hypothetical protein GOODEAATRI_004441, partial [Goodea atripinnis]